MEKMSKKYESANISDVEEHISLKYDIKKRLGKGVSNFFSLFNLVEMNLFAQAVQLLTKLQVAFWANREKKQFHCSLLFLLQSLTLLPSCAVIQLKFPLHLSL